MTAAELIGVLQAIPQEARLTLHFSERGLPGTRETLHLLESPRNATRLRNAIAEFREAKAIEASKKLPPVAPSLADVTLDPEVQAVIFDAFGTLCHIPNPTRPFLRLFNLGGGRNFWPALKVVMTKPLDLRGGAEALKLTPQSEVMTALEVDLAAELASIELYPETIDVLTSLRARGIKLAIASNLAMPYAAPLLALLPFELEAYAWSFEVGHLKPDRRIFEWTCKRLGVLPENTLVIGDSLSSDYDGATHAGLRAIYLRRDAGPASGDRQQGVHD
ncbi:Phosphoglycolate phosphatase [Paraburkholderia ultramafica]|uniref:Phosphoglycolate phosphatase n=2 Tax=Paraburkholderia ultramafica TaxID=1544867 RepID=A0A6S7D2C2_9BURK|nr:Phosphoglycolate phosphatase [Paraburkholderia ultramafica]